MGKRGGYRGGWLPALTRRQAAECYIVIGDVSRLSRVYGGEHEKGLRDLALALDTRPRETPGRLSKARLRGLERYFGPGLESAWTPRGLR